MALLKFNGKTNGSASTATFTTPIEQMSPARIVTSEIDNYHLILNSNRNSKNSNNSVWLHHKLEKVPHHKASLNGSASSVAKSILSSRGAIKIPHSATYVISVTKKLIKWSSLHSSGSSTVTIIVQQRLIGVKEGDQNHRAHFKKLISSFLLIKRHKIN